MSSVIAPRHYRMTLSEFLRTAFIGKPPCRNTIKAAIERKEWLGEKIGGNWFIFVDEAGQPVRPEAPASTTTGNALADALLIEWSQGRK